MIYLLELTYLPFMFLCVQATSMIGTSKRTPKFLGGNYEDWYRSPRNHSWSPGSTEPGSPGLSQLRFVDYADSSGSGNPTHTPDDHCPARSLAQHWHARKTGRKPGRALRWPAYPWGGRRQQSGRLSGLPCFVP